MQIESTLHERAQSGPNRARAPWKRVVRVVLDLAGSEAQLVRHSEKPWASVTFSGARHTIVLAFDGAHAMEAADQFIAALPGHEFTISGRLVADATIQAVDQRTLPSPRAIVEAELLVLDDVSGSAASSRVPDQPARSALRPSPIDRGSPKTAPQRV